MLTNIAPVIICCPNPTFKTAPHSLHTYNLGNVTSLPAFMGHHYKICPLPVPYNIYCPTGSLLYGLIIDTGLSAEKPPRESKFMRNITVILKD